MVQIKCSLGAARKVNEETRAEGGKGVEPPWVVQGKTKTGLPKLKTFHLEQKNVLLF